MFDSLQQRLVTIETNTTIFMSDRPLCRGEETDQEWDTKGGKGERRKYSASERRKGMQEEERKAEREEEGKVVHEEDPGRRRASGI